MQAGACAVLCRAACRSSKCSFQAACLRGWPGWRYIEGLSSAQHTLCSSCLTQLLPRMPHCFCRQRSQLAEAICSLIWVLLCLLLDITAHMVCSWPPLLLLQAGEFTPGLLDLAVGEEGLFVEGSSVQSAMAVHILHKSSSDFVLKCHETLNEPDRRQAAWQVRCMYMPNLSINAGWPRD